MVTLSLIPTARRRRFASAFLLPSVSATIADDTACIRSFFLISTALDDSTRTGGGGGGGSIAGGGGGAVVKADGEDDDEEEVEEEEDDDDDDEEEEELPSLEHTPTREKSDCPFCPFDFLLIACTLTSSPTMNRLPLPPPT